MRCDRAITDLLYQVTYEKVQNNVSHARSVSYIYPLLQGFLHPAEVHNVINYRTSLAVSYNYHIPLKYTLCAHLFSVVGLKINIHELFG